MATPGASLVQDLFWGAEPRLRGRRFGPFDEPRARVVFTLDRGRALEDEDVRELLETASARLEIAALEPRGEGGSSGQFGIDALADLRRFLEDAGRRWPDAVPLALLGHGTGAALSLAAADHPGVRCAALLAPTLHPPQDDPAAAELLAALDLPARLRGLRLPLLVVAGRDDSAAGQEELGRLLAALPRATLLLVPGAHATPLRAPWAALVAEWLAQVAGTEGC